MTAVAKLNALADTVAGLDDAPAGLSDGLRQLADACEDDTDVARQVTAALSGKKTPGRSGGRRAPGPFNPFDVFAEAGRSGLERRLSHCTVEELKDIIAEHGMDRDRLAMKWKTPERLISRVVETVEARAAKGDAFRR